MNKIKKLTHQQWLEIPNHFQNAGLDEFIIMPDHMHGIIIIVVDALHATHLLQSKMQNACNE